MPALARTSAAWMPAMPPPTTSTFGLIGTFFTSSGLCSGTRWMAARARAMALRVASRRSVCTQASCSRMLTIWKKNGFSPPRRVASRNVCSCSSGEQAATTMRLSRCSMMSCTIISWPGSEHMYL